MRTMDKRGIWIALEGHYRENVSRDPEQGRTQIAKIVSDCAAMGFNIIFPCMRTHDRTNGYTSKIEKNYYGWDLLAVFCEEASRHGLQIHPWFCFFGGGKVQDEALYLKDLTGAYVHMSSMGGDYALCPLNPKTEDYMLSLVEELVVNYPFHGFHLDYMRYPMTPCYCDYHCEKFQEKFGADPKDLDTDSELWELWNRFNCEALTDFVGEVAGIVHATGKKMSAAVFPIGRHFIDSPDKPLVLDHIVPGREMAEVHHEKRYWAIFQDWPGWCRKGYLDSVEMMQYTPRPDMIEESCAGGLSASGDTTFLMGLGMIWGQTAETAAAQVKICRDNGVRGICIYDYFNLMNWSVEDRCALGLNR